MKKTLLVGAIALFGMVNAQMTKGDWVISGNTGLGFNAVNTTFKAEGESQDGPKVSAFSFTPSVGYFVIDKLAVGIDLGFVSTTTKYDGDKTTMSSISAMPTATYYFTSGSKLVPFLGAGVGYASVKNEESVGSLSVSETTNGFAWKVKGGVTYMATQSLGINLGLSYDQFSNKETYYGTELTTNVKTFGVNFGLSYFIKSKAQKSDK